MVDFTASGSGGITVLLLEGVAHVGGEVEDVLTRLLVAELMTSSSLVMQACN
jgi:hypothetical protein